MSRLFDERRKQLNTFKEAWDRLQKRPPQGPKVVSSVVCKSCGHGIIKGDLEENLYICPICGNYLSMPAQARIKQFLDEKSFKEFEHKILSNDPLGFPGYSEKLVKAQEVSEMRDAIITGIGSMKKTKLAVAFMDNRFMMGSMGAVVGERLTHLIEYATRKKLPLFVVTSSGGARMQEGMIALGQMAKTSQAIAKHHEAGLFYACLMTNPTTGGVTASFASLADLIFAEPKALIGFAGPRVIADTVKETLPEGFQEAEFQLEKGQIDGILSRQDQAEEIAWWIQFHERGRKK